MASIKFAALIFCALALNVQGVVSNHGRSAGRTTWATKFHEKGNSMIAKIIQMLEEEKDKIAKDVENESKDMEEYMQYCDDEQSEKAYALRTATKKVEDLSALIEDNTAQITAFEEEIAELSAEMAERQEEVDQADKVRAQQHAEFLKREEEQNIMVAELEKMLIELKHQMAAMTTPPPVPVEGEEALAQEDDDVSLIQRERSQFRAKGKQNTGTSASSNSVLTQDMLKGMDMNQMRVVMTRTVNLLFKDPMVQGDSRKGTGLLQQPIDPMAGLGQSAGGENSGGVQVDDSVSPEENMAAFEGLKKKAEEALTREREGESNAQQAHMMNKQSLSDQINLAKYKTEEAQKEKSKLSEEKAEAEAELAETKETMAADNKYLTQLVSECTNGAKAWDARQQSAKAEMAAIGKAKEILASRVTVLVQKKVQTTRKQSQPEQVAPPDLQAAKTRQTLMNHFRGLGNRLKSLSMLNMVSVSSAQPFDKIAGLIKSLIAKLEKEAAEAADTHAFCEEEKKKNEDAITRTTDKINDLTARLDKATAKKAGLAEDIEVLSDEVAEIDKAQTEATKIRAEEKATFTKSEADFKEAADAVGDAIDALNEFYGGGDSLLQMGSRQPAAAPGMGGAKADSSNIIVGMLETMGAEFEKTVADLQSTEHEAQEAYEKMSQENKVAKTSKEMQIKGSKSEISSLDVTIGHFTEDKKMSSEEKKAVLEYVESLKPTCYGRVVSYAERKAKRDAEIEGCKEALTILEESSPSLLQLRSLRH